MGTTPTYGINYPESTAYVKDGATAMGTLATNVDTVLATALNSKTHAGLVLVKTQTIGTGVSSVTVTGAFSTTYDAYKIVISGGAASSGMNMGITLGSANTGYYGAGYVISYATAAGTPLCDTNQSLWRYAGYGMPNGINLNIELVNPFLTKNTIIQTNRTPPNTGSDAGFWGGFLNDTTSHTSITFTTQSAVTMTGGTIAVYGYAKD